MASDILDGVNICLVEDNNLLATVLKKKLESYGAKVSHFTNGLEGLAAIRSYKPDLVLLDIVMPIMNGYEVLEVMNKENLLIQSPVMVVSNSGQEVDTQRVLDLGAADYLVKADFTPNEVVEKARTIVSGKQGKNIDTSLTAKEVELGAAPTAPTEPVALLVEDDAMLRSLVATKLKSKGFHVTVVDNGSEVLAAAVKFKPVIILLDIMLPGKDGLEVLTELKASEELNKIPVIMFSNKSEKAEMERALALGAANYYVKAMTDLNELITDIKSLINR